MSKSSLSVRATQELSQPLDRQVKLYAIAASAAGVSLLALVQPAEAEIIYTAAHAKLGYNKAFYIDLNGDGVRDVRLVIYSSAYHTFYATLKAKALSGGVATLAGGSAADLTKGERIGSSAKLGAGSHLMAGSRGFLYLGTSDYSRKTYGLWKDVQNRFLGVSFEIGGETHYGWVRMNVTFGRRRPLNAVVTGYAYETVANQPLRAGQTSGTAVGQVRQAKQMGRQAHLAASLGMLAAGADCLPVWRRDDGEEQSAGSTAGI